VSSTAMTTRGDGDERAFRLVHTQRGVLVVAGAFAVIGGTFIPSLVARFASLVLGLLVVAAFLFQRQLAPEVRVGRDGYRVLIAGRERFRVAWRDVVRVRAERGEPTLYVETGEAARNLFVPPRGYGFRFEQPDELCKRVLAAVGEERTEWVERIDPKRLGPGVRG